MASVVHSCTIDCPIESVFAAVAAVEQQPGWNPSLRGVRRIERGPIARGSRFVLEVRGAGRVPVVMSELESPTRVRLEGPTGAHTYVLSSEGRRTRLDQLVELRLTGARVLLAP